MFNCGFYSPSALHNADSVAQTHTHAKRHRKKDFATLTSSMSASLAIVCTSSILKLLKFVFICWYAYYLTLSPHRYSKFGLYELLEICAYQKRRYIRSVDVNDPLYEQEIFLLRPCRNFASIKGFLECRNFTHKFKNTLMTSS